MCGGKLKIIAAIEEPAVIERILASGIVGSTAASCAGAAVRYVSGGLIRKPGLVLARADGSACACAGVRIEENRTLRGQNFWETSGAQANFHAVDGSPGWR